MMLFLDAIIGEILGSPYEFLEHPFDPASPLTIDPAVHRYTDETVLLTATCDGILRGIPHRDALLNWFHRYPNVSWGGRFEVWCNQGGGEPYQSFGSGCLARALPFAYCNSSQDEAISQAIGAIGITHNHPKSIKAVECLVAMIFGCRIGMDKSALREIASAFYNLDAPWVPIEHRDPRWESVMAVMPPAISAFLAHDTYEDILKAAIANCHDTDSAAFIAGSLCGAFGLHAPDHLRKQALALLPAEIMDVLVEFNRKYATGWV